MGQLDDRLLIIPVSAWNILLGKNSILQMSSEIYLVLLYTVLSNPICFGNLNTVNLDTAVVALVAGCTAY